MKSSVLFLMMLGASLPPAELQAAGEAIPANHDREIRDGVNLFNQHNNAGALSVLEPLLASAVRENNAEVEAAAASLLGPVYQRLGRFLDAESSLKHSISIWTRLKGENAHELVGPLGNLGALYFDAGQSSRAEAMISRALEIETSFPHHSLARAMLMTNLGSVYFSQRKDDLAEQQAEEALREFGPRDSGRGWDYSIIGAVRLRAGRFEEAERSMIQALAIWKAQPDPSNPNVANGLANLASFYSVTNRPEKAEPLFQESEAIFRKVGSDQAFVRQSLAEYARVEKRLGHKKEAKRLDKQVANMTAVSARAVLSRHVVDVSSFMAK